MLDKPEFVNERATSPRELAKVVRVSIVCYSGDEVQLKATLSSLLEACKLPLSNLLVRLIEIVIVNNGPDSSEHIKLERLLAFGKTVAVPGVQLSILGDGRNLGFGAGHNAAFATGYCDFHLVLNPDVEMAPNALHEALEFMAANPGCGLIAPAIFGGNGEREYLCKRYPAVLDLLLRGFAPPWVRERCHKRLARYEMRDVIADAVVWNPPIISGCFMLLRTSVLKKLNGFDPAYFLYFEDFDLTLRAASICDVAYVPSVKIIHYGGYASRKGFRHIFMFIRSAITFFNRHGWKWY